MTHTCLWQKTFLFTFLLIFEISSVSFHNILHRHHAAKASVYAFICILFFFLCSSKYTFGYNKIYITILLTVFM